MLLLCRVEFWVQELPFSAHPSAWLYGGVVCGGLIADGHSLHPSGFTTRFHLAVLGTWCAGSQPICIAHIDEVQVLYRMADGSAHIHTYLHTTCIRLETAALYAVHAAARRLSHQLGFGASLPHAWLIVPHCVSYTPRCLRDECCFMCTCVCVDCEAAGLFVDHTHHLLL